MTKYSPERQWPRLVPAETISVSIFGKGGQSFGSVSDVSEAGARVVSDVHFQSGAFVLLRIGFDPQDDPFTTEAEIVWSREDTESKEKATYVHGVKLHITEEEQRSRLRGILSRPDFQKDETYGKGRPKAELTDAPTNTAEPQPNKLQLRRELSAISHQLSAPEKKDESCRFPLRPVPGSRPKRVSAEKKLS